MTAPAHESDPDDGRDQLAAVTPFVAAGGSPEELAVEIARLQRRIVQLEQALAGAGLAVPAEVGEQSPQGNPDDPASAWDDGTASFEERLAARQFFHHGDGESGDDSARRWLLRGS